MDICITKSAYLVQDSIQPIHAAAITGHLNVLQLLIDVYGIDPAVTAVVSTKA